MKFKGHTAEALLTLPEVPVRSAGEEPAALWVTLGLLATDGVALQLKLKRAEKVRGSAGLRCREVGCGGHAAS